MRTFRCESVVAAVCVVSVGCGDDGDTAGPGDATASTSRGTTSDTTSTSASDATTDGTTAAETTGSTSEGTTTGSADEGGSSTGMPATCSDEDAAQCDANASCSLDRQGQPLCKCNEGWDGSGTICVNVDECTEGTHDCDANATCDDTQGSYECRCNEYYFGDGWFCALIDPETYVADVSDRPILLELSGVGNFEVHAMGRLAVEISYVSMPGTGFHMERIPTGWEIHDLVIQDISAIQGSDVQDLADWAGGAGNPQSGYLHLDGLGEELLVVALFDVVPVSADTTVTGGEMAEVVLSIGEYSHTNWGYTPPVEGSMPGNSTALEISGWASGPVFLPADISEAAANTADPIELRKIGHNYGNWWTDHAGVYLDWFRFSVDDFDTYGDIDRRSLSEIHLDAQGSEIDRYNCFETFPSLIYLFNPAKIYGSSYLVDLTIVTEWCESA